MDMSRREVNFYLKQLKFMAILSERKLHLQDIRRMDLALEFHLQSLERSQEKNFSIVMKSSRSFFSLLVFQMKSPRGCLPYGTCGQ